MPIIKVYSKTKGIGYKFGKTGKVYFGSKARKLAAKQGRAIAVSKARQSGYHIPKKK